MSEPSPSAKRGKASGDSKCGHNTTPAWKSQAGAILDQLAESSQAWVDFLQRLGKADPQSDGSEAINTKRYAKRWSWCMCQVIERMQSTALEIELAPSSAQCEVLGYHVHALDDLLSALEQCSMPDKKAEDAEEAVPAFDPVNLTVRDWKPLIEGLVEQVTRLSWPAAGEVIRPEQMPACVLVALIVVFAKFEHKFAVPLGLEKLIEHLFTGAGLSWLHKAINWERQQKNLGDHGETYPPVARALTAILASNSNRGAKLLLKQLQGQPVAPPVAQEPQGPPMTPRAYEAHMIRQGHSPFFCSPPGAARGDDVSEEEGAQALHDASVVGGGSGAAARPRPVLTRTPSAYGAF